MVGLCNLPIDRRAGKGFPDSTTPPIPERRWTSENFRLFSFFLRYHHTIPQYRNRDRHHHYQSRKISEKGRGNGIEARGLQLTLNPRYQADLYPTIKSTLVRSVPGPRTQSASIAGNSISLRADVAYDVFWGEDSPPRKRGDMA